MGMSCATSGLFVLYFCFSAKMTAAARSTRPEPSDLLVTTSPRSEADIIQLAG